MIDYSKVPEEDFETVFRYISDAILHYKYWSRDSNFFSCCCFDCGIIRYYDLSLDFYLVKKDCFDLLFCKKCWENIESEHAKRRRRGGLKFETEYYCYEEIIREKELCSSDLQ